MKKAFKALLIVWRRSLYGPEVFLQLHSHYDVWRLWGGSVEPGESDRQAVIRETCEELCVVLPPERVGPGWTPSELLFGLPIPGGGCEVFLWEVGNEFPDASVEVREGRAGRWFGFDSLPDSLATFDRLLLWLIARRIFVFDQPQLTLPYPLPPAVTIDCEEHYHVSFGHREDYSRFSAQPTQLSEIVVRLLDELARCDVKATFFVVDDVCRRYPQLLKKMVYAKHEVACHGSHRPLERLGTRELSEELRTSKQTVEDISGQEVLGFRAAAWSLPKEKQRLEDYYCRLREHGYRYSSSLLRASFRASASVAAMPFVTVDSFRRSPASAVWEFPLPVFGQGCHSETSPWEGPVSTRKVNLSVPYSGGFFLRVFGGRIAGLTLRVQQRTKGYTMLYLHPRELNPDGGSWLWGPRELQLNLVERFIYGFGQQRIGKNFLRLLRANGGCRLRDYLEALERAHTQIRSVDAPRAGKEASTG